MGEHRYNLKGKKVWIIAGEESGDIYGAELARELQKLAPDLALQGMGGREMGASGVDIIIDSTELGVVGLVEVFKKIGTFFRIFRYLVHKAKSDTPDVIVLIDYPGFNLRYAKKMHKLGIRLVYYISPQVWAWKASRIPIIASTVDKMLVIFPFEQNIYRKHGLPTAFVGHPLAHIMKKKIDLGIQRDDSLLLLLPGSRTSEVDRLLKPMVETACALYEKDNRYHFVIAVPRAGLKNRVNEIMTKLRSPSSRTIPIRVVAGETYVWMQKACAGIAASGTVTVQSAILGLPLVVIYKVNPITYLVGKALVKVPYITMVNLIAGTLIYEEFLQDKVTVLDILPALERILPAGNRRATVLAGIHDVAKQLEANGHASHNAALEVLEVLKS